MSKAEKFISDCTRNCSNEKRITIGKISHWEKQHWLTPDEARKAVEIAREEVIEQMMAKAIDGDITFDYYGDDDKTYGCIAHDSFCLEDKGLKDRDKVKLIIIKED